MPYIKTYTSREIRAYYDHKTRAKRFNIPFEFTFEEWVSWWKEHLGPDWIEKRGKRKGQFQMARFGDKGPYAPWNVKCLTIEENISERKHNRVGGILGLKGEKAVGVKLTDEKVIEIFTSKESRDTLAEKFNICRENVWYIQNRKTWKHITDKLVQPKRQQRLRRKS